MRYLNKKAPSDRTDLITIQDRTINHKLALTHTHTHTHIREIIQIKSNRSQAKSCIINLIYIYIYTLLYKSLFNVHVMCLTNKMTEVR